MESRARDVDGGSDTGTVDSFGSSVDGDIPVTNKNPRFNVQVVIHKKEGEGEGEDADDDRDSGMGTASPRTLPSFLSKSNDDTATASTSDSSNISANKSILNEQDQLGDHSSSVGRSGSHNTYTIHEDPGRGDDDSARSRRFLSQLHPGAGLLERRTGGILWKTSHELPLTGAFHPVAHSARKPQFVGGAARRISPGSRKVRLESCLIT
jgi:hypothetical protein